MGAREQNVAEGKQRKQREWAKTRDSARHDGEAAKKNVHRRSSIGVVRVCVREQRSGGRGPAGRAPAQTRSSGGNPPVECNLRGAKLLVSSRLAARAKSTTNFKPPLDHDADAPMAILHCRQPGGTPLALCYRQLAQDELPRVARSFASGQWVVGPHATFAIHCLRRFREPPLLISLRPLKKMSTVFYRSWSLWHLVSFWPPCSGPGRCVVCGIHIWPSSFCGY